MNTRILKAAAGTHYSEVFSVTDEEILKYVTSLDRKVGEDEQVMAHLTDLEVAVSILHERYALMTNEAYETFTKKKGALIKAIKDTGVQDLPTLFKNPKVKNKFNQMNKIFEEIGRLKEAHDRYCGETEILIRKRLQLDNTVNIFITEGGQIASKISDESEKNTGYHEFVARLTVLTMEEVF